MFWMCVLVYYVNAESDQERDRGREAVPILCVEPLRSNITQAYVICLIHMCMCQRYI